MLSLNNCVKGLDNSDEDTAASKVRRDLIFAKQQKKLYECAHRTIPDI
jgi:hypothetical protein